MLDFDKISPELMEKAKQCKTADELADLEKSEGIELNDEILDQLSGGLQSSTEPIGALCKPYCPNLACEVF